MRHLIIVGVLAGLSQAAYAQSAEYSIQAGATLSAFRGPSADASTMLIYDSQPGGIARSNNAYSKKSGVGYSVAGQGQHVTRGRSVYGLQAGYEVLNSSIDIYSSNNVADQRGQSTMTNRFLNAHPFFGHRSRLGGTDLDVAAGPDLSFLLSSREHGKADVMTNGGTTTYHINRTLSQPKLDARARLDLTAYHKRFGVTGSYSRGLTNYRRGWVGGTNEVYSQTWRLGLVYRLG